ncbi:MAG: hypothetical protein IJG13_13425 [Kiritimatiellae bacterium]|nr:hypothetical protein [Kiritimatiellia bacterium]
MRDALTQPPTAEQIAAFAAQKGVAADKAAALLAEMRERQIALRRDKPYAYGSDPPIWFVAKALMRNPVWSERERQMIRRRLGHCWTAEMFADRMRRKLGFEHPVTKLLIMGSNRSGKTDFAAKLTVQTMMLGDKKCCSGAQTHHTQKENQMARVWHYMPAELKARNVATKKAKDAVENISYTDKNGFAGSRVTLANKSQLNFITYEMTTNSLEGVEYDLAWPDEEYGIGHYNLLTTRITSRSGMFLGTFTPLNGYTAPIAAFLNGATTTRWHVAWLRPRDGGEKMPWKELNLTEEEYEKLKAWRREGQIGDCGVPESRPEDCFEWLFEQGDGRDPAKVPQGRAFDAVPRVCVCQGGQAAAVWFYGSDNPYGLPSELIQTKMADENAEEKIYAAVYGMARDMKGRLIKTFTEENVIDPSQLPRRLVRFMVVDPAPERNWCMGWYGYDPQTQTLYKYREWPGGYEVPGQGVPGPWVVPSDKNKGMNDGARGDGQTTFGFGYDQIKYEIARLEGWADYERWLAAGNNPMRPPEDEEVEDWDDCDGARERREFRLLDSRAASQSKISRRENQSLLEDLEELMGGWQVADGQKLAVGYSRLIDKCRAKKYLVTSDCVNTIACYKLLTGKDGQKGAAKDPIVCDRYAVMSDIWDSGADLATDSSNSSNPSNFSNASNLSNFSNLSNPIARRSKIVNW